MKKTEIAKIILGTIAIAGLLSMAVLAPNAIQALKILEKNKKRKTKFDYRLNAALARLVNEGSLKRIERGDSVSFEITEKGKQKLDRTFRYKKLISQPKKWDGIWRMVSFDVFEKRRLERDRLREILKAVGFIQLHQSLWVYPHECDELIVLLKKELRIGRNMLYMQVAIMEGDSKLRAHFGLE